MPPTYHVKDGQSKLNERCDSAEAGLMALCNAVMMKRAEVMHCCKAASYDAPLFFDAMIGRFKDITASWYMMSRIDL